MTPTSRPIALRSFQSQEHYDYYEALLEDEPHRDIDFYSSDELRELIGAREVEAWIAHDDAGPIGWCAVTLRSPHHPLKEAVHFLGAIVAKNRRGVGLGKALVDARLALFSARPITASVLPGNAPSERMLRSAGFRPGLMQGPWRTWHRPSLEQPMFLVDSPVLVTKLLENGIYAEVATTPNEGGVGRIARGLWPDEAAFHAIPNRL